MIKKRKKAAPLPVGPEIHALLGALGGSRPRSRLEDLWRLWPEAVGPELAAWVNPLGSHGPVLILGAHDAMEMQEMHFVSADVLERANAFLKAAYFRTVRIDLVAGGNFCRPAATPEAPAPQKKAEQAKVSGKFLSAMAKTSPVYACYARFAGKGS